MPSSVRARHLSIRPRRMRICLRRRRPGRRNKNCRDRNRGDFTGHINLHLQLHKRGSRTSGRKLLDRDVHMWRPARFNIARMVKGPFGTAKQSKACMISTHRPTPECSILVQRCALRFQQMRSAQNADCRDLQPVLRRRQRSLVTPAVWRPCKRSRGLEFR